VIVDGGSAATTHRHVARGRGSRGQAAVELALVLPVVVLLLLAMLQVALVGRDQLAIELAAREAARAAAVSADPGAAARLAAERVTSLRPLQVAVSAGSDTVTVTVRYTSVTDVAMIGRLVRDVALRATVTMAVEPPG
jgi:Flp pilus assembly protein TadG